MEERLFLDEIAGIDVKIQTKILRVIEYGEYKRVGGNKSKKSRCKIYCFY